MRFLSNITFQIIIVIVLCSSCASPPVDTETPSQAEVNTDTLDEYEKSFKEFESYYRKEDKHIKQRSDSCLHYLLKCLDSKEISDYNRGVEILIELQEQYPNNFRVQALGAIDIYNLLIKGVLGQENDTDSIEVVIEKQLYQLKI